MPWRPGKGRSLPGEAARERMGAPQRLPNKCSTSRCHGRAWGMRTESWFRTRQERAERTLQERGPTLSAVFQAFREVTNDPISEEAARIVGEALGIPGRDSRPSL